MVRFTPVMELALAADLTASPSSWSWTDYTYKVRQPASISMTRGRNGRYTQTPPATAALELINTGGLFVPSNPTSALYGLIDINTPLRVSMVPTTNSASDTFTRTVSSSWGSADIGGAWTGTGGAASDFAVSATFARITNTAATAPHYSTLAASMLRSDITVRVRVNALSTGAAQTVACVSRYASASAANRVELQFGTDQSVSLRIVQRVGGVDTAGTSVTVSGLTHATSTWYWMRVQIGRTSVRAKAWQDGTTQPRGWNLDGSSGVAASNATAGKCGLYAMRETGNTNANATMDFDDHTLVDGPRIQFTGLVDQWPTTWTDASGRQSLAKITASGQLGRVSQLPALRSALFRAHTTDTYADTPQTVAYWPMEDKTVAKSFASGISGGRAMLMSGFSPAQDSGFVGSDALPVMGSSGGSWSGVVRSYTSPATNQWSVRCVAKFPTAATANTAVANFVSSGTVTRWSIVLITGTPDTVKFQGFTGPNNSTEVLLSAGSNFADAAGTELYGKNLYFDATATQSGSNINWTFAVTYIDTNGSPSSRSTSGSVAGTLGNITRVYHTSANGFTSGGYTVGHVAVGRDISFGPTGADAITAYKGETTADRFTRLCAASDVPAFVGEITTATLGSSEQQMGPQTGTTLEGQVREIADSEEGIVFDGKQGQLTLLPRSLRRNHAVNLALSVTAGEAGWPFAGATDNFLFRNDVTVTTPSGSSARAIATGSLAPKMVGAYDDPVSANVNDVDLPDHANWRMRVGTVREARYPQIVLNLARSPQLVESWLDTDVGGRITIANLPGVLDPTPLDLLIEGYTEVVSRTSWVVTLNCSPASPWNAFTWDSVSGNLGRHDTHGSYLMSARTSASTTMRFATVADTWGKSSTPAWSTTGVPYDVGIGGERVTVGTMTTNAITFVAAGTAQHADNAAVTPGLPAGVQQDDVLLVFAATRGSGTVTVPSGYTLLAGTANVALLGKIHSGTESAPSVSPTGGSAGDTMSAQMAAFRNCQLALVGTPVEQLNGSVQNIATPAMQIRRDRCLSLLLGWKQDDWTSVASLSGYTEIDEPSTTTGNDQGLVWDYKIQTSNADVAATSFVVTGGAVAISRGLAVVLAGDVQTATVTRGVNAVTKAQSAGAAVSLWRPGRIAL